MKQGNSVTLPIYVSMIYVCVVYVDRYSWGANDVYVFVIVVGVCRDRRLVSRYMMSVYE